MAIKPKYTVNDISKYLQKVIDKTERRIYNSLVYVGESFVANARSMTKTEGGFGDVTGNLRSSIGYFILKNGRVVHQNLKQFHGGTEGAASARKVLSEVKKINGYQLIGVAGMNYAAYVEAKGYNVITLQADIALIELKEILSKAA